MRSEVVQAFKPAVAAAVFACVLSTAVAAQRGGRGGGAEFAGPPQGPNAIPIMESIGCLADGPGNTWTLSSATEPAKSTPGEHKGHKVLVKGLLITDAAGPRLNITSLTTVSPTCAK